MKITTILFDLDGTLFNTLPDLYDSVNYALRKNHYPERTKDEVRKFLGNGVRVLIEKSLPDNDKSNLELVLNDFKNHYQIHSLDQIYLYPNIIELLKELKKRNIKIGVVTNKFNDAALKIINNFLGSIINFTLGEKSGLNKKPHPDMCNYAMKMLNAKPCETLYVGDSEVDIKTAANACLKGIICSWGFRTKEELLKANAKIIIDNPLELLNYLN